MLSMLNHLLARARIWIFAGFMPADTAPTTAGTRSGQRAGKYGKLESRSGIGSRGAGCQRRGITTSGTLALEQVTDLIPADAHYYFCGPVPFMKAVKAQLENVGVPAERMHYEVFGPIGPLILPTGVTRPTSTASWAL